MNSRAFAAITLKVLGVYVFLQFLGMLPTALSLFTMDYRMGTGAGGATTFADGLLLASVYLGVTSLVYLAFACILFFGAGRLSRLFVETPETDISLSGPVSAEVLTLAFRCLGVYAVVTWFPPLVQMICKCCVDGTWTAPQIPFLRRFYSNWSFLISPTVGSLVGILLIFKAKGLVRLIQLARPMAKERVEAEERHE